MDPFSILQQTNTLRGNKTVLDVGTRNGFYAVQFAELGFEVDTIDVQEPDKDIPGVAFEQIDVETFLAKTDKTYDIIICRNVLHFFNNPLEIIQKLNARSRVFFFTAFGPEDEWSDNPPLSHEEILDEFPRESVRHHSEAFQYGKTYGGKEKFWHINTFVIKNF